MLPSHLCWQEEMASLGTCKGRIRSGDRQSASVGGRMGQGRGETAFLFSEALKMSDMGLGEVRYLHYSQQDQTCRVQRISGAGSSVTVMAPFPI